MTEGPELPGEPGLAAGGGTVSRRRFLSASALAGASLGAGAAACTHPRPATPAGLAAKPAPTATAAPGRTWPSPPAGPPPRWTGAVDSSSESGLAALGATVLAWYGTRAQGFDAATGSATWTASTGGPSDSSHPGWCGVFAETLIGITAAPSLTLAGYDAAGHRVISVPVARAFDEAGILLDDATFGCAGVAGGVAVIIAGPWTFEIARLPDGTMPRTQGVTAVAIDLADGTRLWSRDLDVDWPAVSVTQGSSTLGGAVSGKYCYLQDGATTIAVDLRTGARRWSSTQKPPPGYAGNPLMTVANGALVAAHDWQCLALDAGSGARLWSRPYQSFQTFACGSDRMYVLTPGSTGVEAIDCRTGGTVWSTAIGPRGGPAFLNANMSVSPSLVAVPLGTSEPDGNTPKSGGVLVLSAVNGRPLWAYQRYGPAIWPFSPVLAAGSSVYGLGRGTDLPSAPAPLYAFPPTTT